MSTVYLEKNLALPKKKKSSSMKTRYLRNPSMSHELNVMNLKYLL